MSLRLSAVLLRRGKPRPKMSMFPSRFGRVPTLQKPMQGGQQLFNAMHLRTLNDKIRAERGGSDGAGPGGLSAAAGLADPVDEATLSQDPTDEVVVRLPQADFAAERRGTEDVLAEEMRALVAHDGFVRSRSFNELKWYEERASDLGGGNTVAANSSANAAVDAAAAAEADGTLLPERILDNEYFQSRFGYSLMKETQLPVTPDYGQLDLWGELPKYTRNMYFLYLISRRRNTFAVCFDYDGKKLLKTYTAGNRGLRNTDKGYSGDGSIDNGHQVASMYLNDLLPKIREQRASKGLGTDRNEKIEVVLRLMGFYNGRQGAVRAVSDRPEFTVRYVEDITPFPMNGPKMPRGLYK
jgi:hypothetical protein